MANMVELKVTGLDGVLDLLKKLPPEVVSKNGGPVRSALRKGAVVIQKQAKANISIVTSNGNAGITYQNTGLLQKNIIVARRRKINFKGEHFVVTVRRKNYEGKFRQNAGGRRGGKKISTHETGWMLEYGTSQQPAEPWLRPAAATKAQEAVNVTTTELVKRLNAIVKKLARK
jgi:HK97 gp10 family phage protein